MPASRTAAYPRWRCGLGVAVIVLSASTLLAECWSASFPYGSFGWGLVTIGGAALTGGAWLTLVVLCAVARTVNLALAAPLVAGLAAWPIVSSATPLHLRFSAAKPALERAVLDRGEAGPGAPCPRRTGSYRISSCGTRGSVTIFRVQGAGFLDSVGFAYVPDGNPVLTGADGAPYRFEHVDGPWYTFDEPW